MVTRKMVGFVGVWALTAALGGCLGGAGDGDARPTAEAKAQGASEPARAQGASEPARAQGGDRPDPSTLTLVEGKGALDTETNFVRIAGEVINNTGRAIEKVRITVRLYDASGKELTSDSVATAVAEELGQEKAEFVYSDRHFVPAGERTVFAFLRDAKKIAGTYASHKLSVAAHWAHDPPSASLSGLNKQKDADGYFDVRGTIVVGGTAGCRSPNVVLAMYGEGDKILDVTTETPDETFQKVLSPGGSVAFERKALQTNAGPISEVKAWADCDEPD